MVTHPTRSTSCRLTSFGMGCLQGRIECPSEERLQPASTGLADALAALAAAAAAAMRFLGADRYRTTAWEYIVLVTGGRLLRPRPRATG